ncbi:MAG: YdcF family protein [Erythrobacter sp.]
MILRFLSAIFLAWAFGFVWFFATLPVPAGDVRTDAVIVPTGAAGRIQRGIHVLDRGWADRMLVSGVDLEVRPEEFAAEFGVSRRQMNCCIELGFAAVDTRGNAEEIAKWVDKRGVSSIRLVTSDWHMRRVAGELARTLPSTVTVVPDAVQSELRFGVLLLEYHKLLASRVNALLQD